jgi:hypothetical protein
MSKDSIWRYMSLAKYVDLLRSRTIFFPKASLFPDETEGKWVAHAFLWGQKQKWQKAKANADILQALLQRAKGDPDRILREGSLLYDRLSEIERKEVLGAVLADLILIYPHKREEYLNGMVESWTRHHDGFNTEVQEWASQVAIHRESTYISCWSRADSTSVAMWNLYGGGTEAVAIRSSVAKLKALLENNSDWLQNQGFDGDVVDVYYVDGLNEPGEDVQGDLMERLSVGKDVRVGEFSVKPSLYEYEREVRAILYPKRGPFEPVINPHPDWSGISLPIGGFTEEGPQSMTSFIESVHIHPTLDSESMMARTLTAINVQFGLKDIPIITDKIEAIGPNMLLQPTGQTPTRG